MLTCVLGHGNNLGQQLGKVRKVTPEEAGLEDQALTGVRRRQLTTKEFRLPGDPQGRSPLGVLRSQISSTFNLTQDTREPPYLEGKLLQANGQPGKRLVSRTSLGNNGKLRGRAMGVARSYLKASNIRGLEGSRRGSGGKGPLLDRLGAP